MVTFSLLVVGNEIYASNSNTISIENVIPIQFLFRSLLKSSIQLSFNFNSNSNSIAIQTT